MPIRIGDSVSPPTWAPFQRFAFDRSSPESSGSCWKRVVLPRVIASYSMPAARFELARGLLPRGF